MFACIDNCSTRHILQACTSWTEFYKHKASRILHMSTNIQAALDEAGKVVKKQKTCGSKVDASLDKLIAAALAARQALAAGAGDAVLSGLAQQLEEMGSIKEMNAHTKDLHSSISKLSKVCGWVMWEEEARPGVFEWFNGGRSSRMAFHDHGACASVALVYLQFFFLSLPINNVDSWQNADVCIASCMMHIYEPEEIVLILCDMAVLVVGGVCF
jgi:hypothetical protein